MTINANDLLMNFNLH